MVPQWGWPPVGGKDSLGEALTQQARGGCDSGPWGWEGSHRQSSEPLTTKDPLVIKEEALEAAFCSQHCSFILAFGHVYPAPEACSVRCGGMDGAGQRPAFGASQPCSGPRRYTQALTGMDVLLEFWGGRW